MASTRIGGPALAALLPAPRAQHGPAYAALSSAISALVLDGRIATETRLPSERELALALQVSRATVTAAYDLLRTTGFLTSRTGSGSFSTVPSGSRPGTAPGGWRTTGAAADAIDLSCAALPAPSGVLESALPAATAELTRYLNGEGYEPAGLAVLRTAIADRFTARGVPTAAEQILVTNGAMHAVDLLLQLVIAPGDRVLTELPSYPGAIDGIRRAGARIVSVPTAEGGGWDVAAMRAALRQTAPRLAYLIPDFHNPTGALVPEDARREVLRTARQTGTTVVVDESFVELGFTDPVRSAASIDGSVLVVGSLSKPVWGGLRIGWVRASADLVHRLAALRASIDMGGAVLEQLVAAEIVPQLHALMPARIDMLRTRRDALTTALSAELPGWRFTEPQGGISLWIKLDAALSTPLTTMAAPTGVFAVPGSRFGTDGTLERFLRIPFALPAERLTTAVSRLAGVWRQLEHTGVATRSLVVA